MIVGRPTVCTGYRESRDNSVSIAPVVIGFNSRRGMGISLFTTVSKTALGPTQPPIQRVPWVLSLEVKRPGHEADHSPPFSAEVKNACSYTSTPPIRLRGVVLS
jgi:hypothetical protein